MRLFIAEKPSLGRAIAEVLPKPHTRGDGFVTAANGDTVSWCIGHLLEQAEPDAYDPAYKKWSHEHLPIVPTQWQLVAKRDTAKQLGVLRKLIQQADQLVHAGDPDREGQLLVDEVINFVGVSRAKKDQIKRCLISDLNRAAVKRAIDNLRDNREFIPLSTSALARSRADWLYGMNLTRAYTLQGQEAGYKGVLSVGRVQTPVLGLVVRRDKAIAAFVSKPYYEVWALLETENGQTGKAESFKAKWQPSEHCAPYLDEQGRNLSRPLADNVAARVSHQPAFVKDIKRERKHTPPPLPYNLSSLQIEAGKIFGFSAKQVLDLCQGLYEKHKVITYPRSDCRHLPAAHFADARAVVAAVKGNAQSLTSSLCDFNALMNAEDFDLGRKSRAWNDAKVGAHHAIIPTQKQNAKLNEAEAKIYALVCRNYLAQFLPAHEYFAVYVEVEINKGKFTAKAKEIINSGWHIIFARNDVRQAGKQARAPDEPEQLLPALTKGQTLRSLQAEVLEKHTSPPKAFTDATLLAAMTGISAHVSDANLKKILRDTDGLGTEATRAGIIELLFRREFLQRSGKTITATQTGHALIEALPDIATLPDMTAQWEAELSAISESRSNYQHLMTALEASVRQLVNDSRQVVPLGLKGLGKTPLRRTKKGGTRKSKNVSSGSARKQSRAKSTKRGSVS